jgi:cytolysin (calcineurin-like family phosphatase)
MKRLGLALFGVILAVLTTSLTPSSLLTAATDDAEAITFIVTSDSHYVSSKNLDRIDRNRVTIERMNVISGTSWPDKLGGGKVGEPRGVLALGDLIDDGDKRDETPIQWRFFEQHFGLDGTDGLLKYPVFEGWGNHDGPPIGKEKFGFSVQSKIWNRNVLRKEAGRIGNVAENGLHYSWDWGKVHFVQANLYPADKQHVMVRYSLPWHDPQGALAFVKEDLKNNVGDSGRPVIIVSHCGVDTDWWHPEDWAEFYKAVKPYNVIAYFYGHSGTGLRKYKPEGEEKAIDCVNTGQTEKGFFVAEISAQQLRVGFQAKKDPAATENLEWEWKHLLEKPIALGK